MGRCPPGVLCIESVTLLIVILIAIGVIIFVQNNTINNIANQGVRQVIHKKK